MVRLADHPPRTVCERIHQKGQMIQVIGETKKPEPGARSFCLIVKSDVCTTWVCITSLPRKPRYFRYRGKCCTTGLRTEVCSTVLLASNMFGRCLEVCVALNREIGCSSPCVVVRSAITTCRSGNVCFFDSRTFLRQRTSVLGGWSRPKDWPSSQVAASSLRGQRLQHSAADVRWSFQKNSGLLVS